MTPAKVAALCVISFAAGICSFVAGSYVAISKWWEPAR